MSRGLGKAQRRILKLLSTKEWKTMNDLTDDLYYLYSNNPCWPGSAYTAIYQAVKRLERIGLAETKKAACRQEDKVRVRTGYYLPWVLWIRKAKR